MNGTGLSPSTHILTGQTERIAAVSPNGPIRLISKLLVCMTLILLTLGKFPVSVETLQSFSMAVALTALCQAVLVQWKEPRRLVRRLAWAALLLFLVQWIFQVRIGESLRHPGIAMTHALLHQSFFALTIVLAVLSSRTWFIDLMQPEILRSENPSYIQFLKFAVLVIIAQTVIGKGVYHSNDSGDQFLPFVIAHIAGAFMVIIVITWFNLRTWHVYRDVNALRKAAIITASLVGSQIIFGVLAIIANRVRLDANASQSVYNFLSAIHLAIGNILLGVMLGIFLRSKHLLAQTSSIRQTGQAYTPGEVS